MGVVLLKNLKLFRNKNVAVVEEKVVRDWDGSY